MASMILGIFSISTSSALAGSYQGFCGGTACTITVTPNEIISPYGSIPAGRVTNWGGSGSSETRVGVGVATTIIFGPLGLLGFLAKKHDYSFLVNGFDQEGKRVMMNIQFKKEKPAKDFMAEMQMVTQLGSGQTRTATEIMTAEASGNSTLSTDTLQEAFEKEKSSVSSTPGPIQKASIGLGESSRKSLSNCRSTYLQNSSARERIGGSAPNKSKYDDC